jgi:hypothetical protein
MDVFGSFLAISGATAAGITWSARRRSWRLAGAVAVVALLASTAWWMAATQTLTEWGARNSGASVFLAAIPLPGAAAALWIRWRPYDTPARGVAVAFLIALCCWVPLVGFLAFAAMCNGQC